MSRGRKPTIGKAIMDSAAFNRTVADIVRETGAKPNTVRVVIRRAATKGIIHVKRFRLGMSSRAIEVEKTDDGIDSRLNMLVCSLCGSKSK